MMDGELPPTRPYLIRALYEWCADNGFTSYVAVKVDQTVQVPREYVQDGEIVLNISMEATSGLKLGNEFIEFKARFGGKPCEIVVPIGRVMAIYARENGQGMTFPVGPGVQQTVSLTLLESTEHEEPQPPPTSSGGRPTLKRVK